MNARYYSPGVARFISADTLIPNPTNPQSFNRYSYVLNSPLNFTDPSGHAECDIDCQIATERTDFRIHFCEFCYEYDVAQQRQNIAALESGVKFVAETIASIAFEPADWFFSSRDAYTAYKQGEYGTAAAIVTMAALPLVTGSIGDEAVDASLRLWGEYGDNAIRNSQNLFAFGSKTAPRVPRIGVDVFPDTAGIISSQTPPLPNGVSTFTDISQAPLTGHYHVLPTGTQLPDGLSLVADGSDVIPNSPHPPTHHTIYPTKNMTLEEFTGLFNSLPWQYGGKKLK